ncbi:hypothetical protein TWF696_000290 [Orbilia brochopaga]|uniref:Uncharacterized protein n=1 Tax=Orbilia brochopaga TaxID=3140254 RepID=A0AAV9VB92_9PEZI
MAGIKVVASLLFIFTLYISRCLAAPVFTSSGDANPLAPLDFFKEGITWIGPVHPGGVNHTFRGPVDYILNQIAATPGFDPAIFKSTNTDDLKQLESRDAPHYNIDCTRTSNSPDGGYLLAYLQSVIKIKQLGGTCFVSGPGCHRYACTLNASLDLCNTRGVRLEFTCTELARIAEIMVEIFMQDYIQKITACRITRGDKQSAAYYNGDVSWSPDGKWWYVKAYSAPCLVPTGPTIPVPWP